MALSRKYQCDKCTGLCCRYFALPIDTPEDRSDHDDIRWFLTHEGVSVFVEDGDWYVSVKNKCRHLLPDNRCGIYDDRPGICRKYRHSDCDFVEGEYDYELHFTDDHQMQEYMKIKFDNNIIDKPRPRKKKTKKARK